MYPRDYFEPSEPAEVSTCAHCRGEIYAGDDVKRAKESGDYVHGDCAAEFADNLVFDAEGTIDARGEIE